MKTIILDNNFAEIYYDSQLKLSVIIWKNKTMTSLQYRDSFELMLKFSETNTVYNFLSDTIKQGVVSPEDRKWFQEYAIPEAKKTGLRRGAVVTSGSVFKTYYLNLILKSTNKFNIPLKLFKSQKDAIEWLKSFNDY